jgi:integral membrane protein
MKNPIPLLRGIAVAEAISFLILLGIAMPLKYAWGMPVAVLIAGSIHGCLFLLFCWSLLRVAQNSQWQGRRTALVFVSGLLPTAPLILDKRMKQWAAEWTPADPAA